MSDDELAAIEARANAATLGPWRVLRQKKKTAINPWWRLCIETPIKHGPGAWVARISNDLVPDAEFIAAARTDVPALLAEVRRLQRAIRRLKP